ncbi:MAG: NFACT RNA binding domain-containing protein [Eubacteriales bacterium]|nr:NFACT RNA binding domain-containing protein [Eubacteriales bacterium]
MALDGSFLKHIKTEILSLGEDARVDKIHQPSREEIILGLRYRGGSSKILISAIAGTPRIHITSVRPENPQSPPMFCMLMRKYLGGAKLVDINQIGLDRILHLVFQTTNELGDIIFVTLAIEIMGRHSNIILINHDGKIIDSIKRVDFEMSSVRQILPGMEYKLPPLQNKIDLDKTDEEHIYELIKNSEKPLSKAFLGAVQGVSPLVAREVSYYTTKDNDTVATQLTQDEWDRFKFFVKNLISAVKNSSGTPYIVFDTNGKPLEFSYIPIKQYGALALEKKYESFGELLDTFYTERDRIQRMHSRSNDLLKLISNLLDRATRRMATRQEELKQSCDRDKLRICGDILSSNIHLIKKGDKEAKLQNYYEEGMPEIRIKLNPMLTPSKNVQKYYSDYRKADTAEKKLHMLIAEDKKDIIYLESVFDALTRAETNGELSAIREELEQNGYLRHGGKKKKEVKLSPKEYLSSDGFTIMVGRNNVQNDKLTLKTAHNYDYWFHTKEIPGSHTIVISDNKEVPDSTLEEAAIIAAYNSKARESSLVPVDYTIVKNVKKPNGAKPGMVIYENYKTAYVNPDKELCDRLAVENKK